MLDLLLFSEAVFAVHITALVLELRRPFCSGRRRIQWWHGRPARIAESLFRNSGSWFEGPAARNLSGSARRSSGSRSRFLFPTAGRGLLPVRQGVPGRLIFLPALAAL